MRKYICHLFSLNIGEENKVFQFALLGFLLSLATSVGTRFSDALFLIHVGSNALPAVYTYISYGMILLAPILMFCYHRVEASRVFITLSTLVIGFYSTAYLFFQGGILGDAEWPWYVLRVIAPLMFYPLISSFWSFIDEYHHGSEAKRFLGIYGSMMSLGSMGAGMIMSTGICNVQNILLLLVSSLVIHALWLYKVQKTKKPVYEEVKEETNSQEEHIPFFRKITSIFTHKYTRLVVLGNVFALLMWVIAEYNYMSAFEQRFVLDREVNSGDLTCFMGKCYSCISLLNVVFGFFIYGRLIKHLGIGSMILITPLLFLVTFSGWFFNEAFVFPLMGLLIVEGSYDIVDNSNFTILVKGAPSKIQAMIRVMTLTLFEPTGMLLSGILLTYAPMDSRALGMCVAALAVSCALTMRGLYFEKISFNIGLRFKRLVYGQ